MNQREPGAALHALAPLREVLVIAWLHPYAYCMTVDNLSQSVRGFVFQATYRVVNKLPIVHVFGRLEDGRTFLVREHRQRPHFLIEAEHRHVVESMRTAVPASVVPTDVTTFEGKPLVKVQVDVPGDAPTVRDALHNIGVRTYEADVRFAMRYLIDRGIRGGVAITGESRSGDGVDVVFDDPEVTPDDAFVAPTVLSFDIETEPSSERLLAIACYAENVIDEVVVVDPSPRDMPTQALRVDDERAALEYFSNLVRRLDVDVLTGWNVIDFDLSVLARVAQRVKYDLQLGRQRGTMRIRPAEGYFGSGSANIPGRLVLDGIDLMRGAFVKADDYSLNGVSQTVLGEGKTLGGDGQDKVAEIMRTYREDLPAFCEYARTDARLALEVVNRLNLVDLAFARSRLTGMPADRVAASIASFDFLYLSQLQRRKIAAPSVAQPGGRSIAQGGGAVFEPVVGIHHNVWVCDYKSLYPSIMRTFNIDPLGYVLGLDQAEAIRTYDGTRFARGDSSILPQMLEQLFPQREAAKQRGDEIASQAIKILMNSFYGVLGTPACRFYNPNIANAITSQGRYLLGWSKNWFEARGYRVLYGDTDSVFVASGMEDADAASAIAEDLMEAFNRELTQFLRASAGVESRLELEFEKLYSKLFLASVRGGSAGARKRYAGIKLGSDEVEFVGMEVVRRDWTDLAKDVQRHLFQRLFQGDEVAEYLADVVARLRAGELDERLVYRKGLRKKVDTYTTNVPPHVQAVKKSAAPPPRVVRYVVTQQGPELVDEMSHPPDREHYLERQVKPVAVPVLEALGLDFDKVIGDDRQTELF